MGGRREVCRRSDGGVEIYQSLKPRKDCLYKIEGKERNLCPAGLHSDSYS